ncbi:MAG: glycerol-3-phosphate 1-O-acyltransferase PlsY [Synechocystis sp.]|jgi:glycerol-3-phosphate acyltransferase PlsY
MTPAPIASAGLLLLTAYLLGSIPTGYWAGKLLQGIDIREHGSKSTGATNVLRTLGKPAAIAVLVIDILKGMAALGLVRLIYAQGWFPALPNSWQDWLLIGTALLAMIGHSRSIFLNFTGGKSVATSLGVLFVLNLWLALGTLGTFLIVIAISRIVSLSSILAAIAASLVVLGLQLPLPYLVFTLIAGFYVILRHRANIQRLLQGTEPKLGEKIPQPAAEESAA